MNTKLNWWKAGVAALAGAAFALGWCSSSLRGLDGLDYTAVMAAESSQSAASSQSFKVSDEEKKQRMLTAEHYELRHPFDVLNLVLVQPLRLGVVFDPEYRARAEKLVTNYDVLERGRKAWWEHLRLPAGKSERARGYIRGETSTVLLIADFFGPEETARVKRHPDFYSGLRGLVEKHSEYLAGVFFDDDAKHAFFQGFGLPVPVPREPEDPHVVKPLPVWMERFLRLELPELEGWDRLLSGLSAWGGSYYARYGYTGSIELYHLAPWEVIGLAAKVLEDQPELLEGLRERPELWAMLHRTIAECAEQRFAKYMIGEAESYQRLMEWHEANRPQ
jgi:hypothetical protein